MPKSKHKRKSIPNQERWITYFLDDYKCVNCGECDFSKLSIDHIIPVSQGGKNDISNYQTLCMDCNVKKGVYPNFHLTWLKIRSRLTKEEINKTLDFMVTIDFDGVKIEK